MDCLDSWCGSNRTPRWILFIIHCMMNWDRVVRFSDRRFFAVQFLFA